MISPEQAGVVLRSMRGSWWQVGVDEDTAALWAAVLEPYDFRDVHRAVVMLCRGLCDDADPKFPPSSAVVCRLARECARERGEREDQERRAQTVALPATGAATDAETAAKGAAARDAIKSGVPVADVLAGKIGKPIPRAPQTDAEMNAARRRALDVFEGEDPKTHTSSAAYRERTPPRTCGPRAR